MVLIIARKFWNKYVGLPLLVCFFVELPVFAQEKQPVKKTDSLVMIKPEVADTLIPVLVNKVEAYAITIKQTNSLFYRNQNISPITAALPAVEKTLQGFASRLKKSGNRMNLRSLNSGVIMVNERLKKLTAYQDNIEQYQNRLLKSNKDIEKILADKSLRLLVPDTTLGHQLQDVYFDALKMDSMQKKTIRNIRLLYNRVSVDVLQATDIVADMQYMSLTLKMAMWGQEEPNLFKARPKDYRSDMGDVVSSAFNRSWMIIGIYLSNKWNMVSLGLLIFILLTAWCISNMRRVKRLKDSFVILEPVHFLRRSVVVGSLFVFLIYSPFLFGNPPMSYLHANELLRLAALSFLLLPYLSRQAKVMWAVFSAVWIYYALDDILLEPAFGSRWGLFKAGLLLLALGVLIIGKRKTLFVKIQDSPATVALTVFTLAQVVLSLLFNLYGRASLAKIFGVSAAQCLMLGISLKVCCTMLLEAVYLQSEAYQESRFSAFINFAELQHRFRRLLWVIAGIVWFISLIRNLTLYDFATTQFQEFLQAPRTIGNMGFTFRSVLVFLFVIWLSSVISKFINFFFGQEKAQTTKRSRLGSMMLLVRLIIWVVGFLIAVAAAGIPLDKISLLIGALGVGIGFGLQNIVNNLVSGIILAFERPIQIGDTIEIGNKSGTVKEIGVRSSKIKSGDGADIIVPNGDLLSQHLINWTLQDRSRRVEFIITVSYNVNIKEVKAMIEAAAIGTEAVMQTPQPSVIVNSFTGDGIDFKVLCWVEDLSSSNTARSSVMLNVFAALSAAGVEMPQGDG